MEARLEKIERKAADLEIRINIIEKDAAVSGEQIKMIFNILNEIKTSIKDIADKMDEKSEKPATFLWGVGASIIVALIIAGLKFIQ